MSPTRPGPGHRPFGSAVSEPNVARGPHTPIPPPLPRAEPRPEPSNAPPPPARPAREKLDSREVTQETLLQEYKGEADARRAAERRAAELQLQLAAAESGVNAHGPSLGSAKWWAVVIAAIAIAAPQIKELIRPSASAMQIAAVQQSILDLTTRLDSRDKTLDAAAAADGKRWTISAAFACSQGLRARGLDCDAANAYADIQPLPLKPKVAPTWKATALWPIVPTPKD